MPAEMTEPILIVCEGSGCSVHLPASATNTMGPFGICQMCGAGVEANCGIAKLHTREDILAMIDRGDYAHD